ADRGCHVERDPADLERDQAAERCQRHNTKNQSYVPKHTESRIKQDDHESQNQAKDQSKTRLSPLLVLEMSDPLELIRTIKRNLFGDGALGLRQKRRQAATDRIEFDKEVASIHVAIDCAFALLALDSRNLR